MVGLIGCIGRRQDVCRCVRNHVIRLYPAYRRSVTSIPSTGGEIIYIYEYLHTTVVVAAKSLTHVQMSIDMAEDTSSRINCLAVQVLTIALSLVFDSVAQRRQRSV
jgi:hypothetical protein